MFKEQNKDQPILIIKRQTNIYPSNDNIDMSNTINNISAEEIAQKKIMESIKSINDTQMKLYHTVEYLRKYFDNQNFNYEEINKAMLQLNQATEKLLDIDLELEENEQK